MDESGGMKEPDPHHRHRFPAEIISHAVWLYHVFSLSLRDVEMILAERGVLVSHETIRRWCRKFGQGVVTLTGEGQTTAVNGSERGRSGCFPDARLLPPDPKGLGPRRPVLASGHAVSA